MTTRLALMSALTMLCVTQAGASTLLTDIDVSPDTAIDAGGTVTRSNQTARDDLAGTLTLQSFAAVSENADLVAYERSGNGALLTFDISIVLPGGTTPVTARPADVMSFDGVNYSKVFDAVAAGIPDGVRIDAVATDGSDLLLSFDITVDLGSSLTATDEDLVRWDGAGFTLYLDISTLGINPALDLDGAHRLNNGNLLLSFDGSGAIGSPTVFFDDEDILEYDPAGAAWELAYDASAQATGWSGGPDVDAFDAAEPLFIDSWLQVGGSAQGGTVFITVAGVPLSVIIPNGHTPDQVIQAIADAIEADTTLAGMGVTAMAVGDTLYTNGVLTAISTTDAGLVLTPGLGAPPPVDGDINLDGAVNAADVLYGLQVLGGAGSLTPIEFVHGDVAPLIGGIPAPDELFTLGDLIVIQRKALGLISF